jgi:SAM-dependent methyltransferase
MEEKTNANEAGKASGPSDIVESVLDEAVRLRLRKFSNAASKTDQPLSWFEQLYESADRDDDWIPWDNGAAHPFFSDWIERAPDRSSRALVVGCGLGDDAVLLAELGWNVTAFDLSPSAIKWASERHSERVSSALGTVRWLTMDLTNPPYYWAGLFDLVLEVHILQAIPEDIRERAAEILPKFLNETGHLVCIGRLKSSISNVDGPPWPLERTWILDIGSELDLISFDVVDSIDEISASQRYRVVWRH